MAAAATATTWVQDSPFGAISITLGPNGITSVELPPLHGDFLFADGEKRDPTNKKSRRVGAIGRQFDEYFAGRRTSFVVAANGIGGYGGGTGGGVELKRALLRLESGDRSRY